jgi:TonB family protein
MAVKLHCSHLLRFSVVPCLLVVGLYTVQAQDETHPSKQGRGVKEKAQLKAVKAPIGPMPEEARKKGIQGTVVLSIVVNRNGNVSDAKTLSGPPELLQTALDSIRQWKFEPPASAPVATTVEVGYGYPKECPGSESEHGEVTASTRLQNKEGTIFDMDFENDRLPPYPEEARKAGMAGELILSLTLTAEGRVTMVSVIKSLSPQIDKTAVETVRTWKFKPKTENPNNMPGDFSFHIFFRPTCNPQF